MFEKFFSDKLRYLENEIAAVQCYKNFLSSTASKDAKVSVCILSTFLLKSQQSLIFWRHLWALVEKKTDCKILNSGLLSQRLKKYLFVHFSCWSKSAKVQDFFFHYRVKHSRSNYSLDYVYLFCSTRLPLSSSWWVRSTFLNHCPLSSYQGHQLSSAASKSSWKNHSPWKLSKRQDSNPGQLGEKHKCYSCALLNLRVMRIFVNKTQS